MSRLLAEPDASGVSGRMNYPLWDLPASGLLIAVVAILHVFVSHFAVGGGLFLVVTEAKARRENDTELLDYLRRHSRFFILLTLVFGAVTGVGIWFTIGLVHPAATSSLISTFVWVWAIEWAFFFTEIAAAIVYYYGWDRLTPKQHLSIGWIYFGAAWMSLAVINGILAYMLTPGAWIGSRSLIDGFFNPTYWPSLIIRTLGAIGIAGVYALFTASWLASDELKAKLSRYAMLYWVLPLAVGLPFALLWYFAAAAGAGVPVAEFFGTASAGAGDLLRSLFTTATSGHPIAQQALRTAFATITLTVLLVFTIALFRRARYGRVITGLTMVAALLSIGASEWVREDLRKPYVIGSYMFVNGLRMPPPSASAADRMNREDPLRIDRVQQAGILSAAMWTRVKPETRAAKEWTIEQETEVGGEIFRVQCSQCHTLDGYLAIRPLVKGRNVGAIDGTLARLAAPRGKDGHAADWSTPGVQLMTWRNRRMPPFIGTEAERRAVAVYLATIGGGKIEPRLAAPASSAAGASLFEESCAMCHGADGDWPMTSLVKGRSEAELYGSIGELPVLNDMMPPFEGSDEERRALAQYLAALGSK